MNFLQFLGATVLFSYRANNPNMGPNANNMKIYFGFIESLSVLIN
jgi:hypothetical protein